MSRKASTSLSATSEEIAKVVHGVIASMQGDLSAADLKLYQEIQSLADYIHAARQEIASLRPNDLKEVVIPSATDELDAIVEATAEATSTILDAAEAIEKIASEIVQEKGTQLTDITTRIYEACNFQDITGQRITKVVKALQNIESKIEALVQAFGSEEAKTASAKIAPEAVDAPPEKVSDAALLNGPQLPDAAKNQSDIDALFNTKA
jgi:chemotaxis protein CheZ